MKPICPFRSQCRRCTHYSNLYSGRKTSSKKTSICPYKNVSKCPILKRWRGENLDNNTNI